MNIKLQGVSDASVRPLYFFMIAGWVNDYVGAPVPLDNLLKAQWLLGDRGYVAHWFRNALHPNTQIAQRAGQVRQTR